MKSFDTINKNFVAFVIEKVLLDINNDMHSLVKKRLMDDYHLTFSDCYGNPEYLSLILKDLFGDSYATIVDNIRTMLKEHATNTNIDKFIQILSK